jgi:hypothetical protein
MKAYVVSQIGWEYNDNEYYQTEYSDGKPVKVFLRKERAEAECRKRERQAVWELMHQDTWHGLFVYGWEHFGAVGDSSLGWLESKGVKIDQDEGPSEEAMEKIRGLFEKNNVLDADLLDEFNKTLAAAWYEVVEVELDDETLESR